MAEPKIATPVEKAKEKIEEIRKENPDIDKNLSKLKRKWATFANKMPLTAKTTPILLGFNMALWAVPMLFMPIMPLVGLASFGLSLAWAYSIVKDAIELPKRNDKDEITTWTNKAGQDIESTHAQKHMLKTLEMRLMGQFNIFSKKPAPESKVLEMIELSKEGIGEIKVKKLSPFGKKTFEFSLTPEGSKSKKTFSM